jgi:pyridoxamine 5'-phosphate oxidase
MTDLHTLANVRREYGNLYLDETTTLKNPFQQFKVWFEEILEQKKDDPTAMILSTVDKKGLPDSRVVLLKGIENQTFIFYTNYESAKAIQISNTPYVALNFYWPQMARQVRIRGSVKKTTKLQSDTYFANRPITSQISALVSPQSKKIENRNCLEEEFNKLIEKYAQKSITRPENWGGYSVYPEEIEFWQGRDNRLHDRIHYLKDHSGIWLKRRLAP